jgi:Tol biopolymer transport system component
MLHRLPRLPYFILASIAVMLQIRVSPAAAEDPGSAATGAVHGTVAGSANGRIAFSRLNGPDGDIYTVEPDGSSEAQVSSGPDLDEQAVWSPAGTDLLVMSEDGVETYRDIVYASPGGVPVHTDIYLPPSPFEGPRPGIVIPVFQGFQTSDRNHPGAPDVARNFARSGYVVYVFSIRLWTDGHLYPAAEDDARALVSWVRANADAWNTDPERLGAFGGSGGAYLAAVLAYKGGGDLTTGTRVRAFAGWSGPMNLWEIPVSSNNQRAAGYLGCDPMSDHATPECVQLGKDASPTEMVSPDDPPALIRNSTDESVPIEQARAMKASLEAQGIPLDYEEIEGDAHAYHLKKTEMGETLAFFDRNLLAAGESSAPLGSGIYRMAPDGSSRSIVVDDAAGEGDPGWSPDGMVAFGSDRDGDQEVYVVPVEGGDPVNLSLSPSSTDRQPDWSPDGSRIAFISDRLGSHDLFTMGADGLDAGPLVVEGEGLGHPAWSPDGNRIAFERRAQSGFDIYVVNADGTGLLRLTDTTGDDRHPAWSPDGTRIAFSSNRSGNDDIYAMNADGTAVILVSGSPLAERHPSWQPIPPPPGFSVDDVTVTEGNAGTVEATFRVRLSRAVTWPTAVGYQTVKGFSTPGVDYTSTAGRATFEPGETEREVTVVVAGDATVEANESFFLDLLDPSDAVIEDGRGQATILDDDGPCLVRGTPGNDKLEGTSGPDVLCGFGGNDEIIGGDGDDILVGGPGKDVIFRGGGTDQIAGGDGGDRLFGEAGNDDIDGGLGGDFLHGGAGDDRLTTVDRINGNDSMDGGEGTDTPRADPGDVVVNCP